jgi:hypothetical protein
MSDRIEGFFSLWFNDKPYIFKSTQSNFSNMIFPKTTTEWFCGDDFMNKIHATECMKNISMHSVVGGDAVNWCHENPNQILVVYCGDTINLEMKYMNGLLYRSYQENV